MSKDRQSWVAKVTFPASKDKVTLCTWMVTVPCWSWKKKSLSWSRKTKSRSRMSRSRKTKSRSRKSRSWMAKVERQSHEVECPKSRSRKSQSWKTLQISPPMSFRLIHSPLFFIFIFTFVNRFSSRSRSRPRSRPFNCRQKVLECSIRLSPKGAEDSFRRPLDCPLDVVVDQNQVRALSTSAQFLLPSLSFFSIFYLLLAISFTQIFWWCLVDLSYLCHDNIVQSLSLLT